jgi:hypothetical protein
LTLPVKGSLREGSIFGYGTSGSIPFGDSWESVGSASFALAAAGDSILIYCLDENDGSYRHLGGIISGTWAANELVEFDTSESQKPDSLAKVGAIEIERGWDNLLYVGTTTGSKAGLLSALADSNNWEGSNTGRLVYSGTDFGIDEDLSPQGAGIMDNSAGSTTLSGRGARAGNLLLALWLVARVVTYY